MSKEGKMITILLADDDPDDRQLTRDAFAQNRLANELHCVEDGEELLDYLHRRGRYENLNGKPLPGLILLDLNMPRKNGAEVMIEIRSEPALHNIPIVVLTTSNEEDVPIVIREMADGFITKPATFDEWIAIIKSLAEQWLVK